MAQTSPAKSTPWISQQFIEKSLSYGVFALTCVTGIAFGFSPMNTFLSVSSDFSGILGSIMQWAIILPSCFFQTILWWNAYYQPAIKVIPVYFASNSTRNKGDTKRQEIVDRLSDLFEWTTLNERMELFEKITQKKNTQLSPDQLARFMISNAPAEDSTYQLFFKEGNTKNREELFSDRIKLLQKDEQSFINLMKKKSWVDTETDHEILIMRESILFQMKVFLEVSKYQKLGVFRQKTNQNQPKGMRQWLLDISRSILPVVANTLNVLTINPFGVFFAFYTALLTLTFPGIELSTLILPSAVMPIMVGLLVIGYSAGAVCAAFLTSNSFRKTVNSFVDELENKLCTDPDYKKVLKIEKDINALFQTFTAKRSDPTWSWLTNRPILGMILAVGCALSVCILNYYSGIQAAMLLGNINVLLTPSSLTSAHNLMNASLAQKAFGAYSALVTVGMTSALLLNVGTSAQPREKVNRIRAQKIDKAFYWAAIIFSTLGQLFCNYVNTVKPHGILSALRLMRAPCEQLLQSIFGLFSFGGTIIVTKLHAESADQIIDMRKNMQLSSAQNKADTKVRRQFASNSWSSFFDENMDKIRQCIGLGKARSD